MQKKPHEDACSNIFNINGIHREQSFKKMNTSIDSNIERCSMYVKYKNQVADY